jgi:hypothetical protein
MSKAPKKQLARASTRPANETASPSQAEFDEVLSLIDAAKARTLAAVNTSLCELNWNIGQHVSRKIGEEGSLSAPKRTAGGGRWDLNGRLQRWAP